MFNWLSGFGNTDLLATYSAFALALAGSFYATVQWFGKSHLSNEAKETLTLWLWGEYDSTWSHHFCNLFDGVFGNRHLSLKCFVRSSIASLLAVLTLYVLFAEVLGIMGGRVLGDLSLWQALLFGAAINIIPDYISLFETRWLLKRFERIHSVSGQLAMLFADALLTGIIIWLGINAFQLLSGNDPLSIIEMVAVFSVFSVFFYSTFLTSAWAWIYCLSTWFMRLFSRSALNRILDVETRPVAQVALVGAVLIFTTSLAAMPVLEKGETQQSNALDRMLCKLFDDKICLHIVRFTRDESEAFSILSEFCDRSSESSCIRRVDDLFAGDTARAIPLWTKSCDGGYVDGCRVLGTLYHHGRGVAKNSVKATELFLLACEKGNAYGCHNLGLSYQQGLGVSQDHARAVELYRRACSADPSRSCYNLGLMYRHGDGIVQDNTQAATLFQRGCDYGDFKSCNGLGIMAKNGYGMAKDPAGAIAAYNKACDGGNAPACNNLGSLYRQGEVIDADPVRAVQLYDRACNNDSASACDNLADMYKLGLGIAQDAEKATALYRKACKGGFTQACMK